MKAVFMDYTGTMVKESGKEIQQVVMRICKNSSVHEPDAVLSLWWKLLKQYEEHSYGDSYLTEDEIVDRLLADLEERIHLKEKNAELHSLIQKFWVYAPQFEDVFEFFENCPLPIYVISNNGKPYIEKSMGEKGLSPVGIICADMVRAYKPHKELFEKALEACGCSPKEVVHIGDSYTSDVQGALSAGIRPVLIQRNIGKVYDDVMTVRNLQEVLPILR